MRKNNGFTLIELLAVILILGIITLIAIPTVNTLINDSQKSAFKVTCENIYNELIIYEQLQIIKNNESCFNFNFSLDIDEDTVVDDVLYTPLSKLNISGELPDSGYANVCNGKAFINISNNKYTCKIDESSKEILEN